MPSPGNPLELRCAPVLEAELGSRDEVFHRRRDENLTGAGSRTDAVADVDCQAAELVADNLALPGVQSGANLETERRDRLPNRRRAPDCADRAIEGGEKAVACRVELPAAEPVE